MVMAVEKGSLSEFEIQPQDLGVGLIKPESLLGGDAAENSKILISIFDGSDRGPRRQAVQINAAAALVVAGKAPDLKAGWNLAEASLNEGCALASLQALQKASTP
jgi:anthranilate phosphoribosyltransferase